MHKAVIEAGQIELQPEVLIEFESKGRVLLIADASEIQTLLPELTTLECYVVVTQGQEIAPEAGVTIVQQKLISISGWLGEFEVTFDSSVLKVDLVLDLSEQPVLQRPVLPLGYYAPADEVEKNEVVSLLPEMVGIFDKPKYFNYEPSICAHSRRGVKGCQQCVDACPAEAVVSSGMETVEVNPNLCQGCGSCVSVCPSGAMSYALPTLDVSMERLRKMVNTYYEIYSEPAILLIFDETKGAALIESIAEQLPDNVITFQIEEVGVLGIPFWLSAMAYGIAHITVLDAGTHQDHDWIELQSQMRLANQILSALDYQNAIQFLTVTQAEKLQSALPESPDKIVPERAQFAGIDDKRRVTTLALNHLHQHASKQPEVISFAETAPFGEIEVNQEGCTLCMSCVSVCPAGALLDGVDKPQLNFIEDLCVQCGICESACPEKVISLKPRYLFDRNKARSKRLIYEEPVFHCVSCQKPFATQKMIDNIMAKLSDHPMFQGEAKNRLMMCEDCKVRAMFNNSKGPM